MTRQQRTIGRRLCLEVGFEPRRSGQEALADAYQRLLCLRFHIQFPRFPARP